MLEAVGAQLGGPEKVQLGRMGGISGTEALGVGYSADCYTIADSRRAAKAEKATRQRRRMEE